MCVCSELSRSYLNILLFVLCVGGSYDHVIDVVLYHFTGCGDDACVCIGCGDGVCVKYVNDAQLRDRVGDDKTVDAVVGNDTRHDCHIHVVMCGVGVRVTYGKFDDECYETFVHHDIVVWVNHFDEGQVIGCVEYTVDSHLEYTVGCDMVYGDGYFGTICDDDVDIVGECNIEVMFPDLSVII